MWATIAGLLVFDALLTYLAYKLFQQIGGL